MTTKMKTAATKTRIAITKSIQCRSLLLSLYVINYFRSLLTKKKQK